MTFVYRKTFSSRKRNAQYVGNSKKQNLRITKHLQRLKSKYKKSKYMKLFMKIYNQKRYVQCIGNPEKHNSNVYKTLFRSRSKNKITKSNYT